MAKHLIVLLIAFTVYGRFYGQNLDSSSIAKKKVVLIVPFNRFDFHTEFSLHEIADQNRVEVKDVYDLFKQSLLNSFVSSDCETYQYRIISDFHLNYLKRRITYSMSRKPMHYSVDLSMVQSSDLKQVMDDYQASYVLFLNWYHIKKDNKAVTTEGYRSSGMSRHFIDYEVYNSDKDVLLWAHEHTFETNLNKEILKTMGLRVVDLQKTYKLLPLEICKGLQ